VEEINEGKKEEIKDGYAGNENNRRNRTKGSFHAVGLGSGNRDPSNTCILLMSTKSV
jgi:hypothetical protein